MDRRIVAGLMALLLAGLDGGKTFAQTQPPASRDPSSQPSVGMGPIRSINDSINDVTSNPFVVPMVTNKVPTSPVGTGPAAAIPSTPENGEPVSMTPIDPLHHSLTHGFAPGRVASLFRKPGARPTAPSSITPSRYLPRLGAMPTQSPNLSRVPALPSPSNEVQAAVPNGRPSPYAGQSPDSARPQADPVVKPASAVEPGRRSPYLNQIPADARPRSPSDARPAGPRPRIESTPAPANRPAEPDPIEPPAALPIVLPPPSTPIPTPTQAATMPPVGAVVPSAELPAFESIDTPASSPLSIAVVPPAAGLPDLDSIETQPAPAPAVASRTPAPASVASTGKMAIDDQVRRTSGDAENKTPVTDEAALQIKQTRMKRKEEFVTFSAATVGDDIITINELEDAVRMQMVGAPDLQPGTPEFHEAMNHVAAITLQRMIEERLILQEAKWKLRDKAKLEEAFNEYIDKIWKTEELPVLLRENGVSNAYELKAKLRAKGQNYDSKKEAFRRREMARSFLNEELRHKVSHDMIELKEYYEVHKNDFIKPARITWREIEINVRRYPDRATARKKADEALARLLHNESFEAVARAISNGPTATQGGLYVDMTPGSYADPGVNQELSRLPLGQVSQVIESPTSFHIVRVDSRRDKGPLRFDEVAEQINEKIFMRNYQKAYVDYMAKLQAKTVIRTMFENSQDGLVVPDKKPAASR